MFRYDRMSPAQLAKALHVLVAHERRALDRAEQASTADISRRATLQAADYTARREAVEQLLRRE
jgi:hypothetical protein